MCRQDLQEACAHTKLEHHMQALYLGIMFCQYMKSQYAGNMYIKQIQAECACTICDHHVQCVSTGSMCMHNMLHYIHENVKVLYASTRCRLYVKAPNTCRTNLAMYRKHVQTACSGSMCWIMCMHQVYYSFAGIMKRHHVKASYAGTMSRKQVQAASFSNITIYHKQAPFVGSICRQHVQAQYEVSKVMHQMQPTYAGSITWQHMHGDYVITLCR